MTDLHEFRRLPRRCGWPTVGARAALLALICACATVLTAPAATATGEPQVTVDDITVDEPRGDDPGSLPFTVMLESPAESELAVPWRLHYGKPPALQGIRATGTIVFAPGESTKSLSLPLTHDPFDHKVPFYYTLEIRPTWSNNDRFGVATVNDTTRDGDFSCSATAYQTFGVSPTQASSGMVHGKDCSAGSRHDQAVSDDGAHLTVADSTMQVVQYADNRVNIEPAAGDGGEAHVRLRGVVWRIAPGLVLRAASVTSDARIVCTSVGALPLMEASSSVTGLRINGAPPLGTITDEYVIDLAGQGRIVLNEHQDQSVVIAGGPDKGEPHRTIGQQAIRVSTSYQDGWLGRTSIGQLWGNPCDS